MVAVAVAQEQTQACGAEAKEIACKNSDGQHEMQAHLCNSNHGTLTARVDA
jgi:hypothetical protein